jgi:small GTP-binding protein
VFVGRRRVDDEDVNLLIWDLAGEEEGSPIQRNHVVDASGLILVADGCSAASLQKAIEIRDRYMAGDVPTVLLVNKVDLHDEWQVDIKSLRSFEQSGLAVFTTSAKNGRGVEEMFLHIARAIVQREDHGW